MTYFEWKKSIANLFKLDIDDDEIDKMSAWKLVERSDDKDWAKKLREFCDSELEKKGFVQALPLYSRIEKKWFDKAIVMGAIEKDDNGNWVVRTIKTADGKTDASAFSSFQAMYNAYRNDIVSTSMATDMNFEGLMDSYGEEIDGKEDIRKKTIEQSKKVDNQLY